MKRPETKGFVSVRYVDCDKILISIRGDKSIELRKLVAQYIDLAAGQFFICGTRLHSKVAFDQPMYPVSVTATICELYNMDEVGKYMNYIAARINYATCGKENDAIDNMKALIEDYK